MFNIEHTPAMQKLQSKFAITYTDPLRQAMTDAYRADENLVMNNLVAYAKMPPAVLTAAHQRAYKLVEGLRKERIGKGGIDAFLSEYNLSSQEGIALMCIAESMLRIPDADTINRLIKDKITSADWKAHIGKSDSLFVNAATWSLMLTGKIITDVDEQQSTLKGVLKSLTQRSSEPVIRKAVGQAMRILGKQFVMGRTIKEALKRAREHEKQGYRYSYDMLGEGARTAEDAERYQQAYIAAITEVGQAAKGRGPIESPGISVKLSALYPRYEFSKHDQVLVALVPKVVELAVLAKKYNIGLTVDAEEAVRLDLSLDIIEQVFSSPELAGWEGFGLAIQAYQKRCFYLIDWLVDLSKRYERRLMVRLVKGAYWDSEIKQSQVEGLSGYPVFTRKDNTDISYLACAKKMLQHNAQIYPQFATHNAYSLSVIMELAQANGVTEFEFQCLHGMGQTLYDQIVGKKQFNIPCRIYAPVGSHKDLLPYLVRRLLENGANTSFVNRIVDAALPIEELLADPVAAAEKLVDRTHSKIPLPKDIFGANRKNSAGLDLSNPVVLLDFQKHLAEFLKQHWQAKPTLAEPVAAEKAVTNPADNSMVGSLFDMSGNDMDELIKQTQQAQQQWQQKSVTERANCLRATADLLEQHRVEFYALAIREAGKTIKDAVAEVREAIDFCRYYAEQAERLSIDAKALGIVLCISPWNFPLAIFLGQVSAALVTGNAVLAKPAEQTPLIAARAVELLHQAGVPKAVVQLTPGRGSVIGNKLVGDPRIRGVIFTGSTETAQRINQTLAQRGGYDVPLIAETGGQNAMIVDSSALPEQIIDDVVLSAFGSAGQRCSALRVLFVQTDIADNVIHMLKGAMAQLKVGDPRYLATDIGPVIDDAAVKMLQDHAKEMATVGQLIYQCSIDPELKGSYFAPTAFEIKDLSVLKREVFGPILHVVRYRANDLDNILQQIKATGYGLTMGIHSRIEHRVQYICEHSAVGNTYVNRSMIGAVVGVQPFGGEGLSGTGPKAGGPHYLNRLCTVPHDWPALLESGQRHMVDDSVPAVNVHAVSQALLQAKAYAPTWAAVSVEQRVTLINKVADKLSAAKKCFIDLLMGKEYGAQITLNIAERKVQMALDNLCFYARQAKQQLTRPLVMPGPTGESNQLMLLPRGVVVSITPWRSPLITTASHVASALVAGNCVIVKPAQQTSAIVLAFAELCYQAGIPREALHVLPGNGKSMGEQLVLAPETDVLMFSGDDSTAKTIKQLLARRDGPLVPLVLESDAVHYIERVTVERTLTVNTTASGGNAALLSLT